MTLSPSLTKVVPMTRTLGQDYLENVLGWKALPEGVRWPSAAPESSVVDSAPQKLFAVYAPHPTAQEEMLLTKMMKAIEVTDFERVEQPQRFDDFLHILVFHEDSFSSQLSKMWSFETLSAYTDGDPQEVSRLKKQAWEKLKRFRQEVLK
jgi:hypothetical protein